ncbi:Tm-1-like ATP-binding domain-containing protein [Paenibacillus daejeonensis]|uniref:Tm-1-like ATP-binding domain-containing protein n=1 Tax=Paenibacillus daejeonensis TaxID=135193 RepID=UPI00036B3103|nr:Tm-1-like ATP-binding domain-containing protein [Paenibacillus daejeonensis]
MHQPKQLLLIGTLDTKGEDYRYIRELVTARGHHVITVDIGVAGEATGITPEWTADEVARRAGTSREALRKAGDRGQALAAMADGAMHVVEELYQQGRIDGILGMGGTGGTSVIAAVMRHFPVGFPKVLVSTAASGNTQPIVGTRDVVLIPSVVDVAGVNSISELIYRQAAAAVCGMMEQSPPEQREEKPLIAITMFGNTTAAVERCKQQLEAKGYECLVFHCTGIGGRTMEGLVTDGRIAAVLDMTTTEWADELCGGVFTAGANRLEAPGRSGVPHLVVPGCIDMVNFGGTATVPERYQNRLLYAWNANVTLMRTSVEENEQLGEIFAQKLNAAQGPVTVLIPSLGYSLLGASGERFHLPEADNAFEVTLREHLHPRIPCDTLELTVNDEAFADEAVNRLLAMIQTNKPNQ